MFPAGSTPVQNPHGTAPGIDFTPEGSNCRVFALPGVPAEMKEMFVETIRPALMQQHQTQLRPLRHFRLKCFGTGESSLEAMLPDLIRRGREPTVGITVSNATITLRVTAQADSDQEFADLIDPTLLTIRQSLGNLVFGEEDEELQHAVVRLLNERDRTVAVAEWGTSGLIAQWMQELPDAKPTPAFVGGQTVTSRSGVLKWLGIDQAALSPQELAKEMAIAVRARAHADFGLAVGPFPELDDDRNAKVFFGLATEDEAVVAGRRFAGHPSILKTRAAKQALDVLRLHLTSQG